MLWNFPGRTWWGQKNISIQIMGICSYAESRASSDLSNSIKIWYIKNTSINKGKTSTRYRKYLIKTVPDKYEKYCITTRKGKVFRFWQTGGGYDRNLWNTIAIHHSIEYIEANPLRVGFVESPEDWIWSSAHARKTGVGIIPDELNIPMLMKRDLYTA